MELRGTDATIHLNRVNRAIACLEPFIFTRYSDGELFMLLDKEIKLTPIGAWIDGVQVNSQKYAEHDCKTFNPNEDKDITNALSEAYKHKKDNYIIGMPYSCCVGKGLSKDLIEKYGKPKLHTTANLITDNNYPKFIKTTLKLIQKRNIILIAHKSAKTNIFPELVEHIGIEGNSGKKWRLICDRVEERIKGNYKKEDILVLSSASYISNLMGHRISQKFEGVSFMDIGTSLHPMMGLGVIRQYLSEYWTNPKTYIGHKCICQIDE